MLPHFPSVDKIKEIYSIKKRKSAKFMTDLRYSYCYMVIIRLSEETYRTQQNQHTITQSQTDDTHD